MKMTKMSKKNNNRPSYMNLVLAINASAKMDETAMVEFTVGGEELLFRVNGSGEYLALGEEILVPNLPKNQWEASQMAMIARSNAGYLRLLDAIANP